MNPQKFRDARDGIVGAVAALAFFASCGVILLGVLGYFDQSVKYKFPGCGPIEAALLVSCREVAHR